MTSSTKKKPKSYILLALKKARARAEDNFAEKIAIARYEELFATCYKVRMIGLDMSLSQDGSQASQ